MHNAYFFMALWWNKQKTWKISCIQPILFPHHPVIQQTTKYIGEWFWETEDMLLWFSWFSLISVNLIFCVSMCLSRGRQIGAGFLKNNFLLHQTQYILLKEKKALYLRGGKVFPKVGSLQNFTTEEGIPPEWFNLIVMFLALFWGKLSSHQLHFIDKYHFLVDRTQN